jgi:hypothetical protein
VPLPSWRIVLRRSPCRGCGCIAPRSRWTGSARGRGQAWMPRSGTPGPGCTSGSSRPAHSTPCTASPAAAPGSTTPLPAHGGRASARRSWAGASSAHSAARGRT